MSDKIITFAKALTVGIRGFKDLNTDKPELGFMTPNTGDSAYKKRLETLKSWTCIGSQYNPVTKQYEKLEENRDNIHEIENTPTVGFQILNVESRYSTDNKVFRLKDPRGFLAEIYTGNLEVILQTSDILKGGYITEPCVWGRLGSNNVLVAVSSEAYQTSVKFAETKSTDVKTLTPGDIVKFKTGPEEIYLGEFALIALNKFGNNNQYVKLEKHEKIHAFLNSSHINLVKKPSVFSITGKSDIKIKDMYFHNGPENIDRLNWSSRSIALINKTIKIDSFKLSLNETRILHNIEKEGFYLKDGRVYILNRSYFNQSHSYYSSISSITDNSYTSESSRTSGTKESGLNSLKRNEIIAIEGLKVEISTNQGDFIVGTL